MIRTPALATSRAACCRVCLLRRLLICPTVPLSIRLGLLML